MKIGILTFHYNDNFGAVLQAVGLSEYLISCGYDAEIIDYRPPMTILSMKGVSWQKRIRRIIGLILSYLPHKFSMRKFNKFREEHLKKSDKIFKKLSDFPDDYDIYIIGSDQVWNEKVLHRKIYKLYQGKFKRKSGSKLISYAASAGNGEELLANSEFCSLLNSYDAVSVREKTLQDFIQNSFNISPQLVIDPTLLVDKKLWLSKVSRKRTKPYLLIFLVNRSEKARQIISWAQKIASIRKWEIKYIPSAHHILSYRWYKFYSPQDFLNLFYNAEFIITTSFHGCCFSMIYEKPFHFLSFDDKNENRVQTLLTNTGLKDRIISLNDNPNFDPIDYNIVNNALDDIRLQSQKFLHQSL